MAVDNSSTSLLDTFMDKGSPTVNWGTDARLIIGTFGDSNPYRPVIKFTTPNVSGTITQIDLIIRGVTAYGSTPTLEIYPATTTGFTELGCTWNKYDGTNNWTSPGGDFGTIINSGSAPTTGTNQTLNLYGNGATNPITPAWNTSYYFIMKASVENGAGTNAYAYSSKRGAVTPYLSITYTEGGGSTRKGLALMGVGQ